VKTRRNFVITVGLLVLVCGLVCFLIFRHRTNPGQPPTSTPMYSTFGPSNSFGANCWSASAHAHADWFVPPMSGRLEAIEIAIEPSYAGGGVRQKAGDLDLFLAKDDHGFPGPILERFVGEAYPPESPPTPLPLVFKSAGQPSLRAGEKYWLGARSAGPVEWRWHFGGQQLIVQKPAREDRPGHWVSAGDSCYASAFSILVNTNQTLELEAR
jgi:hypothetical protein